MKALYVTIESLEIGDVFYCHYPEGTPATFLVIGVECYPEYRLLATCCGLPIWFDKGDEPQMFVYGEE